VLLIIVVVLVYICVIKGYWQKRFGKKRKMVDPAHDSESIEMKASAQPHFEPYIPKQPRQSLVKTPTNRVETPPPVALVPGDHGTARTVSDRKVTPDGAMMVVPPGSTEPDLGETNTAYQIEQGDETPRAANVKRAAPSLSIQEAAAIEVNKNTHADEVGIPTNPVRVGRNKSWFGLKWRAVMTMVTMKPQKNVSVVEQVQPEVEVVTETPPLVPRATSGSSSSSSSSLLPGEPDFDDEEISKHFKGAADAQARRGSMKVAQLQFQKLADKEEDDERREAEEEAARKAAKEAARLGPDVREVEIKTSRDLEQGIFGKVGTCNIDVHGTLEDTRLKLISEASFIKPPYRFLFVTRNEELVSTNKEASILVRELFKKDMVKIHVLRGKEGYGTFCPCGRVHKFKCGICATRGYCSEACQQTEHAEHVKECRPRRGSKQALKTRGSLINDVEANIQPEIAE